MLARLQAGHVWLSHADQPAEGGLCQTVLSATAQDSDRDVVGEACALVLGPSSHVIKELRHEAVRGEPWGPSAARSRLGSMPIICRTRRGAARGLACGTCSTMPVESGLEEVVRAFNDGGYSEMVAAFLADEAGAVDE